MKSFKIAVLSTFAAVFLSVPLAAAQESSVYKSLLTPLLQTGADTIEQPVVYPDGIPKITAAIVTIPPGGETGWHNHQVPLFVYILEGEVSVDYGENGTKVYKQGVSFMEAMNSAHNATNKGTAPVRIMAVYMGAEGKINAAAAEAPK